MGSGFKKKEANNAEPDSEEVCFLTNSSESAEKVDKNKYVCFYADSGASNHLIKTEEYFHQGIVLENPIKINVAKKEETLVATNVGTILTEECKLWNVLYVPNLRNNLLSINKIEQSGFGVKFEKNKVTVYRNRKTVKGYKKNNLYKIKFKIKKSTAQKAYSIPQGYKVFHRRLGHASMDKINELKKRRLMDCETEGLDYVNHALKNVRQTTNTNKQKGY